MLPVSITVVIIRIIFKLKLADIVINVTAGGPGGATDTVSSFIYREYRDRSNVGYGTMLAMFYLVMIIVFVTLLLRLSSRWMRKSHKLAQKPDWKRSCSIGHLDIGIERRPEASRGARTKRILSAAC